MHLRTLVCCLTQCKNTACSMLGYAIKCFEIIEKLLKGYSKPCAWSNWNVWTADNQLWLTLALATNVRCLFVELSQFTFSRSFVHSNVIKQPPNEWTNERTRVFNQFPRTNEQAEEKFCIVVNERTWIWYVIFAMNFATDDCTTKLILIQLILTCRI